MKSCERHSSHRRLVQQCCKGPSRAGEGKQEEAGRSGFWGREGTGQARDCPREGAESHPPQELVKNSREGSVGEAAASCDPREGSAGQRSLSARGCLW
ncbi:hypothetical protein E2C01_033523 [Portunus trituberculatus]|uniref:Uncharacterized protein n=1 Tax=Portunus trituberculatus TaxID=210409 RepID=A0A5B7EY51_PORTR|nr:hypothetical protein [Portunus trituberculatus]